MANDWTEEDDRILEEIHRDRSGDRIGRTAGALADNPHWDGIMDEVQRARKQDRP
ncbi:MAG: hypothetical protein K8T91_06705 [Planctomycetes bacterium]|nr:hypothetical protein [Planctomycetota bacterium]